MKKKESTKFFWYAIAIGFLLLFFFMLLSSVLDVGDRLKNIHEYLAYAFYALVAILIYLLILRPIHIIAFSPAFSVETSVDPEKAKIKNKRLHKKVKNRLLEQDDISIESKQMLTDAKDHEMLLVALNHVLKKDVKKKINRIIKKNAKTVMLSTAISQNGRLDFLTVFTVNLKMIKEIVVTSGFRPSFKNLSKLTVNVFSTALIAEGLENLNINDILPTSTINAIGDIPLIRPILSSVIQGISNALLTLRIGIVARKYLFSDAKEITKEEIRRTALIEAAYLLPTVVGEALLFFPKRIAALFKKAPKKEAETEIEAN